jgi:hypothetical protein
LVFVWMESRGDGSDERGRRTTRWVGTTTRKRGREETRTRTELAAVCDRWIAILLTSDEWAMPSGETTKMTSKEREGANKR